MIINSENYSNKIYLEHYKHIDKLDKLKNKIYLKNYILSEEELKYKEKLQMEENENEDINNLVIDEEKELFADYDLSQQNILLKDTDEKFLLKQLNILKTVIFYDLILPKKMFEVFKKDIEMTIEMNKIADDRDIELNEEVKDVIKKSFYMIYSEEDKNKKRISYEVKNKMLDKDLKKIFKIRNLLYQETLNETLNYNEYKKIIQKQSRIIVNINPTTFYYKVKLKELKELYKRGEVEDFVNDIYIKTIEMNIERIRKIIDILVLINIRLVINLVKQYMTKVPNNLNFNDIKNEGILGFIQAIYKFNPYLDQKLSTYATWWIRQAIISEINKFRNIVPVPLYYSKIIRLAEEAKEKLLLDKIEPTDQNIVNYLIKKGHNITLKKLQTAKSFITNQNQVNISGQDETDEGEDKKNNFEDILSYLMRNNSIDTQLEEEEVINILKDIIENQDILTPKEKLIIKQRLPLFTDEPKTLEEIGKKMNRTKERVRQLETDAFNKIKKILPLYYEDLNINLNDLEEI